METSAVTGGLETSITEYIPKSGLPKEIVLYIASFLTGKEQVILSYLNKHWRNLFDLKELKMKALLEERPERLISYTYHDSLRLYGYVQESEPVSPHIHFVNKDALYFSENWNWSFKVKRVPIPWNSSHANRNVHLNELQALGPAFDATASTKYFISYDENDHLTVFEKNSGKFVFRMNILQSLNQDAQSSKNSVFKLIVYPEDDLSFLIILRNGVISKWTLKNEKPVLVGQISIPECERINFAEDINDLLYLTYSVDECPAVAVVVSLEKMEIHPFSEENEIILSKLIFNSGKCKHIIGGTLYLVKDIKSKTEITSINLGTGKKNWTQNWDFVAEGVTSYEGYLILADRQRNLYILNLQTQKLVKKIEVNRKSISLGCFDCYLFVFFTNTLLVFELPEGKLIKKWEYPDQKVIIKNVYYKNSKIFFIAQQDEKKFSIEYFQFENKAPPFDPPEIKEKIVVPEPPLAPPKKSRTKEIVAIVLSALGFLFVISCVVPFYCRAINLSVGLGCSALFTVISAGALINYGTYIQCGSKN